MFIIQFSYTSKDQRKYLSTKYQIQKANYHNAFDEMLMMILQRNMANMKNEYPFYQERLR